MRISTQSWQQLGTNAILQQQRKLANTQLQLSTGQRILTPADDPAASTVAMSLKESLETYRQYQANMGVVRARLALEDSTLEAAANVLQRARELTVQGLNDSLNASDRAAIAKEVDQLLEHLLGLANTRNVNGEYIFSGFRSASPPFIFDSGRVPQGYAYQGDSGQRLLAIAADRAVADGDPGSQVFELIPSEDPRAIGGTRSVLDTLYQLRETLIGNVSGSHGAVRGTRDVSNGIDYSSAGPSFNVAVNGGPPQTVTLAAGNYRTMGELLEAINGELTANPNLQGLVKAQSRAGFLEFVSTMSGSSSSVQIMGTGTSPDFLAGAGFSDPQEGSGMAPGSRPLIDSLNALLMDMDQAIGRILDTRASTGARLNALDTQQAMQDKFMVDTESRLSEIQDLDFAEAISRFNLQQVALQAAQQSYARVQGLSLFNYL